MSNEKVSYLDRLTMLFVKGLEAGGMARLIDKGDVITIGKGSPENEDSFVPVMNQATAYNVSADNESQWDVLLTHPLVLAMGGAGIASLEGIPTEIEGLCCGDEVTVTDVQKMDFSQTLSEDTDKETQEKVLHTVTVRTAGGDTYRVSSGMLLLPKGSLVNGVEAMEALTGRYAERT